MSLNTICSNILFALAAYNLSKLPWYLGLAPVPEYGLEASMPFHTLIGYRGSKLQSHPVLFLVPHATMGSIILILFGLYLRDNITTYNQFFLPLTVVFALHVIPERSGIPNRSKGKPLNEVCFITILSVAAIFYAGFLSMEMAMKIAFVPCLGASVLELLPVISCAIKKVRTKGEFKCHSNDGDEPLKRNMSGYSGCPFAKTVDITTQGYPFPKKKE
jgi:hypothetical protein